MASSVPAVLVPAVSITSAAFYASFFKFILKYPGHLFIQKKAEPGKEAGRFPTKVRIRTPAFVLALESPPDTILDFTYGPPPEGSAADAMLRRFVPKSDKIGTVSNANEFIMNCRIVAICQIVKPDGRHVIKVCLQHRVTKEVVFLSTGDAPVAKETREPAIEEGWHVHNMEATAPGRFWINAQANIHM
jgi:hypothetical protein